MARRTARRSARIICSLAVLGVSFFVFAVTGPQGTAPAFETVAASKTIVSPPKKPPSSYLLWLKQERPAIVDELGTVSLVEVSKEAGERWRSLSEKDKKPFHEEAAKLMETYADDMENFIAEHGRPPKKKKDPKAPKRPASGFILWIQENRQELLQKLPSDHKASELMKLAGTEWQKMSPEEKAKYQQTYMTNKEQYRLKRKEYVASLPSKKKDSNAPKRPAAGFILWVQENRQKLMKNLPSNHKVSELMKLAGTEWQEVSPEEKAKYQQTYMTNKEEYQLKKKEYLASPSAKPLKKKKDPNAPKRPMSGYMLWFQENRQELSQKLPAGHRVSEVSKLAGTEWKKLSAGEKAKYRQEYVKNKADYQLRNEEYLASLTA